MIHCRKSCRNFIPVFPWILAWLVLMLEVYNILFDSKTVKYFSFRIYLYIFLLLSLLFLEILQLDSFLNPATIEKFPSFLVFIGLINICCEEMFGIYRFKKTNLCQRHKHSLACLHYKARLYKPLSRTIITYICILKITRGIWLE